MMRSIGGIVGLGAIALAVSLTGGKTQTTRPVPNTASVFTDLGGPSCKEYIDQTDPNSTPYTACPGAFEFSLIIRHVGSGRQSIDIVTPTQQVYPLDYHDYVTRQMSHLGDEAEWRIADRDGQKWPVAVIVPVHVHENMDEPERVSRSYFVLAKISPSDICVTQKIPAGSMSRARMLETADSAPEQDCLDPLPAKTVDGDRPR
ncbi:hypothetical protein [uncultured Rhodospira sp.]|uniref:hypothetical protein n=1 Tax=uncultured Rhodospira sp. TaxID=1936189 RepID=UPI002618EE57|nr:hypothetical protein [uncultured Rhodospira sp.]